MTVFGFDLEDTQPFRTFEEVGITWTYVQRRSTMNKVCIDVMIVSLTVNVCALSFNIVPRLRRRVIASPRMQHFDKLVKICRHFDQRPFLLAKIITDQSLLWLLIILSLVAICVTDVIRYPFQDVEAKEWHKLFWEAILGINVGRYTFMIVQLLFVNFCRSTVKYRSILIHHFVTLVCYSLLLAYRQNVLLGLIGTMVESTTMFEDIGHYFMDREKRHTKNYKRLVVISCVFSICFRGLIPLTFLVIAIFRQTPFVMDNIPLTVFFLSSIFFAVINMWDICLNIQRLIKNAHENHVVIGRDTCIGSRVSRGTALQMSKNNLGYLRPYDNKNIANHFEDEKHNLNNHKDFPKETLELHIQPSVLMKVQLETELNKSNSTLDVEVGSEDRSYSVEDQAGHHLRISNGSTESSDIDSVLIAITNTSRLNNSVSDHTFTDRPQDVPFSVRRSQSYDLIHSELCPSVWSENGISV